MMRLEFETWSLLIKALQTGLDALNLGYLSIIQGYQENDQGKELTNCVILHRISKTQAGFQSSSYTYEPPFMRRESQFIEDRIQLDVLVESDPLSPTALTALDVANNCRYIIKSQDFTQELLENCIGVLKVEQILMNSTTDEHGLFYQSPSFTFTLSYEETIITDVSSVEDIQGELHQVD